MEALRPTAIVPGCLSATHNQSTMIASPTEPSRETTGASSRYLVTQGRSEGNKLMQAIVCREHGGPEVMQYQDIAQPEPAAREVLIQADAIGVNHADTMRRSGKHPAAPKTPFRPGIEVCAS